MGDGRRAEMRQDHLDIGKIDSISLPSGKKSNVDAESFLFIADNSLNNSVNPPREGIKLFANEA